MCTALICRSFLMKKKNKISRWRYIDSATVDLVLSFFRMQFAYLVSFTRVTKDVLHLCVYVYWSVFVGALLKRRQTNEAGFDKILFSNCWIHRTVDRLRVYT